MWHRDGQDILFRDRADAGAKLAEALAAYAGPGTIVLGIPRGGVVIAAVVASGLRVPLDLVVARKLGAPDQPELAIGAVTAGGARFLDDVTVRALNVSPQYLVAVTAAELAESQRRERGYRDGRPPLNVAGRTVLLVDDGLATGATMRAAARLLRAQEPVWLVIAAPVGSPQTVASLEAEADAIVCLHTPEPFYAVGLFYERFDPVSDDDVTRLLGG